MPHVFISYVRENAREVKRLVKALEAHHIDVWLDRDRIKPGHRWKDAIRDAITEGEFFIACFSSEYLARKRSYMNEELTLAIDELRQRPIDRAWFIPVQLSPGEVPDRSIGGGETLKSVQWVALYVDWDSGISQIVDTIAPNRKVLAEQLERLHSDSARARIRAADDLSTLGSAAESAIPRLIELLDDDNQTVCAAAAHAIGQIGVPDEEAIVKLIRMTELTTNKYSKKHANAALVLLSPKAMPILRRQLANGTDRIKIGVLKLMLEMGHDAEPATPEIIDALKHEYNPIRVYSSYALGNLGGERAVSALSAALPKEVNYWAHEAITAALAATNNSRAVPPLRTLVLDTAKDVTYRLDGISALDRLGHHESATAVLREIFSQYNGPGHQDLRLAAAGALAKRDERDAIDALSAEMCHGLKREWAAVALGASVTMSERAKEALIEEFQRSVSRSDTKLILSLAEALAPVGYTDSVRHVRKLLRGDTRRTAATVLGKYAEVSDEAVDALHRLFQESDVRDDYWTIKIAASLSPFDDRVALSFLWEALRNTQLDADHRRRSADALGRFTCLNSTERSTIHDILDGLPPILVIRLPDEGD